MKKQNIWTKIISGLLVAVMVFGPVGGILPTYVSAEKTSEEVQAEIDALKGEQEAIRGQLAILKDQLSDNLSKLEDIVKQKNLIDQRVFFLNQEIQNIEKQIIAYGGLIADKQEEYEAAIARWEKLNRQYKERIRIMEEEGQLSYWSVIFKASSFSDLLDRINMISEIATSDQRRLQELNEAAQVVEAAKSALETEKTALETGKADLLAKTTELAKARQTADALLEQLLATGDEYKDLIHKYEDKESNTAGKLDELENQLDEIKRKEYEEWLESQKPKPEPHPNGEVVVDGVTWLTPIVYKYFSSPFGYRWHPIHGDWRMHYGVDLSAPQGTPIVAARSGMVYRTAYEEGGAGYYVNIDHMDGYITRYLHMTHYIVSPGQYVEAGEVIGYCGSTGGSTGPHLHYSVYYNHVAINPAPFIKVYNVI